MSWDLAFPSSSPPANCPFPHQIPHPQAAQGGTRTTQSCYYKDYQSAHGKESPAVSISCSLTALAKCACTFGFLVLMHLCFYLFLCLLCHGNGQKPGFPYL